MPCIPLFRRDQNLALRLQDEIQFRWNAGISAAHSITASVSGHVRACQTEITHLRSQLQPTLQLCPSPLIISLSPLRTRSLSLQHHCHSDWSRTKRVNLDLMGVFRWLQPSWRQKRTTTLALGALRCACSRRLLFCARRTCCNDGIREDLADPRLRFPSGRALECRQPGPRTGTHASVRFWGRRVALPRSRYLSS